MKKALIVGINYEGTGNDLRGCLNDAENMRVFLASRGFEIEMCLEKAATTAGMKAALGRLVAGAVPGDVLVFHYSGHGSQLPSKTEADGFEEILCPIDLNWTTRVITDDTLRQIFNTVPNGVNTTLILDCCHSGTALDQTDTLALEEGGTGSSSGVQIIIGGKDRYLPPPAKIEAKLADRELVDWSTSKDVNESALLIAGCKANQTSADAHIDNVYQGAATYALLREMKANPDATYRELVTSMNEYMRKYGYSQRPQLDGFSGLYDERFVEPFGSADEPLPAPVPVPPAPPAPPAPAPAPAEDSKKNTGLVLAVVAIAILAAIVFLS